MKKMESPGKGPNLNLSNNLSVFQVFKSDRRPHVLNVPVRIGKRKLRCICGGKLLVKKIGLWDYSIECAACRDARAVSLLSCCEEVRG